MILTPLTSSLVTSFKFGNVIKTLMNPKIEQAANIIVEDITDGKEIKYLTFFESIVRI